MLFTRTELIEGWLRSGFVIIGRDRSASLTKRRTKPLLAHGTLMGHCQPARHNNRQLTAYEKVLLFSGLTIAGSCGELGELVSEGLIIRLTEVRVLVAPPFNSKI